MRLRLLLSALAVCLLGLSLGMAQVKAPPAAAHKSAFDKPTLEAYVRHLYNLNPQFQVKVGEPRPSKTLPGFDDVTVQVSQGPRSQDIQLLVSKDGQHIVVGQVFDIAQNPFHTELEKLAHLEGQPSFGVPGAPVVLVEFSDFQCPYCKEEAKVLRSKLAAEYPKDVRVYFVDFPLEQIHPWARSAAIAGRCVIRESPATFWDFHDWMYENQGTITPENLRSKVTEWATASKKVDPAQLGRCMDSKSTNAEVDREMTLARSLDVNQTPYLFLNGRRMPGARQWEDLKSFIDFELNYQKTEHNAGEQSCCSLELPLAKP